MTGRVIDAETKKPIDGAIVLVEWTITHGYGFSSRETYEVFEGVTNGDGEISIPGVYHPFVNPPDVTVYKQGYVAWNSRFIFPNGYVNRTDFEWKNGYVFLLEQFKPEYTYNKHSLFVSSCIGHSLPEQKKQIKKATQFEWDMANIEDNERRIQLKGNTRKTGDNP